MSDKLEGKKLRDSFDIEDVWLHYGDDENLQIGTIWLPRGPVGKRINFNKKARDFFARTVLNPITLLNSGTVKPTFSRRTFGWWNWARQFWGNLTPKQITAYFNDQIKDKTPDRINRKEF
jgi:hypothetical protein